MAFAETAKLAVELSLKDRMSGGLKGATSALGRFETSAGRAGQAARNAAANTAKFGLIAGGFIVSQAALGVRSLAELERLTQQTAAAIETTGGVAGQTTKSIRDLSEALEDLTTVDDKAVQAGANVLLTYTNIGEETFPRATKAATDLAVALAQGDAEAADVAATARLLGKALNDPAKSFGILRKAGIAFDAQTEKVVKGLIAQGKVAEAQAIILSELEKRYGKAGEAAAQGFGGDLRKFSDAVEEAQMALATGLLPVIREFTAIITKELKDPRTIEAIKEGGRELAGFLRAALTAAKAIPWGTIAEAMKLSGQAAKTILDVFTSLPPWVQTAVLTGWGLNKLTGGILGDVLGEAAKGLIKGVLGINAGVVNVMGKVVNAPGGLPGGGKPGGGIPPVAGAPAVGAAGLGVAGVVSAVVPAAIVAAMLAAPYIFKGKTGTGPQDVKVGNFGDISWQTAGQAFGASPGLYNALNQTNAPLVTQQTATTAAINAQALADQRRGEQTAGAWDELHQQTQRTYDKLEENRTTAVSNGVILRNGFNVNQTAMERTRAAIDLMKSGVVTKLGDVNTAARATAEAIRQKDMSVSVTVPISVSTSVSIRDWNRMSSQYATVAKVTRV